MIKKLLRNYPGRVVLISVICTIIIGACLLALPIAQLRPISPLDALFTAVSATCVCGLLTVPITEFSTFGHAVIFVLMQIGGLGIVTLTLMLMSLIANIGLAAQTMAGHIFEFESIAGIRRILSFIICLTVGAELSGALIIMASGSTDYCFFKALFHAVASFCNAGISLEPTGMMHYAQSNVTIITTMILIFIGGTSFITWYELAKKMTAYTTGKPHRLSLQSKIVLAVGSTLIVLCALILWTLEPISPLTALFTAISVRSTGFSTLAPHMLHTATIFMIMLTTFIGSAPGSTGSGIKTTVLTLFLSTARAIVSGRPAVEIFGRTISRQQVYKALTIIMLSISWIALIIFLLLITENNRQFLDICFEVISAFSNLGLTLGITPLLSISGKIYIMATMIIGRIGSLSLILALTKNKQIRKVKYPEERIILS